MSDGLENTQNQIFITRAQVKALGIPGSNSTWLRNEANGRFPRRIRLSASSLVWDRQEILDWMEMRKAERKNWYYADVN